MKLSVIMPVYNEESSIREIIDRVKRAKIEGLTGKEIIVVNDGSTDGTGKILENGVDGIKLISLERNVGKGWAIREGLKQATGDIVIIQDGDLEYNPDDYESLIHEIIRNGNKVVYGSRILNRDNGMSYVSFYLGGRLLSLMVNLLYNARLTDMPTCYKVFRADVLRSIELKCRGFEFCPEVTAKLLKKGIKIREIPIRYYPRKLSEGKKITGWDGLKAIFVLLKCRFVN
jgi:glycosyltransferase involved in cell wall biosynthesis